MWENVCTTLVFGDCGVTTRTTGIVTQSSGYVAHFEHRYVPTAAATCSHKHRQSQFQKQSIQKISRLQVSIQISGRSGLDR